VNYLFDLFSPKGKKDTINNTNVKDKSFEDNIVLTINKIKAGDKLLREEFIKSYTPYVIRTISNLTGKYIDIENSDEFSVGLAAFNEAIDSFDEEKNIYFFKFSTLVIKRRLTDYARHNKKHCHVYPFTYFEDKNINYFEQMHLKSEIDLQSTYEIGKEIELYEQKLREFGISLELLAKSAPKHKDSKYLCLKIAKVIADNQGLFSKLERTRNIPKTELLRLLKINKKTIERNRTFIIAAALIFGNDFYLLKDFIDFSELGGDNIEPSTK